MGIFGLMGKAAFSRAGELPPREKLPVHIAVIMDGNGRWATRRGLPRTAGHAAGSETFDTIATFCNEIGIKYLTVYAFSTENWTRPQDEVSGIFSLLRKYLIKSCNEMVDRNVKLKILGDLSSMPHDIMKMVEETESLSKLTTGMQANVCINYGGRHELASAAKTAAEQLAAGVIKPGDITEQYFGNLLYSAGIPDPDLLIRTGGEQRISNFLLWQLAYTEMVFTNTLWPDFGKKELSIILRDYAERERRFGGVKTK